MDSGLGCKGLVFGVQGYMQSLVVQGLRFSEGFGPVLGLQAKRFSGHIFNKSLNNNSYNPKPYHPEP